MRDDIFSQIIDDVGQGMYRWLLRGLRWCRVPVLVTAVAMFVFGAYLFLTSSVPAGLTVGLGGLLIAGLNVGTWKHVERFTKDDTPIP